ncbi:MAG: hypothetical protein KGM42_20930 [Hyphomicrobiales bacterium]|nr:hypothetical protein [Hyphomicrobiales bacterium]
MSSTADTIEIFGNYGIVEVNAADGTIRSFNEADSDANEFSNYRDIVRFDVDEWREFYKSKRIAVKAIDILDIGFWYDTGLRYAAAASRF